MHRASSSKLCALACTIGWSAFWVFGYLALSAGQGQTDQQVLGTTLAFAGFLAGSFSYIRLGRDGGFGRA